MNDSINQEIRITTQRVILPLFYCVKIALNNQLYLIYFLSGLSLLKLYISSVSSAESVSLDTQL